MDRPNSFQKRSRQGRQWKLFLYRALLLFCVPLFSCTAQESPPQKTILSTGHQEKDSMVHHFYRTHQQDSLPSSSLGTVSNGTLKHGTLLPFSEKNYRYFDTTSYLAGRGFLHRSVAKTIQKTYAAMEIHAPKRIFRLMECSNKHGGKMYPHRTHQNGLSVDFMMPKRKHGKPCYELDNRGAQHYLLEFDNQGRNTEHPDIIIDFDMIALHLLELQRAAQENGLKIKKVIINTNLKDELFASNYGEELRSADIYIVQRLSPLINSLHDDHYHVDFEFSR